MADDKQIASVFNKSLVSLYHRMTNWLTAFTANKSRLIRTWKKNLISIVDAISENGKLRLLLLSDHFNVDIL